MKILLISVLVLVSREDEFDKINLDIKWKQHKFTYSLKFDEKEEAIRKNIFIENSRFIEEHNAKNSELKLKMNQFGHLRTEEVLMNKVLKNKKFTKSHSERSGGDLPVKTSIDWRTFKVVSPIKNQLNCGSCYAFSGIGAIESQYAIHKGRLPLLSEQEIVDCSHDYGNDGCHGGLPIFVYNFAKDNGLVNQSFYPYVGEEDDCRLSKPIADYRVKSYVEITEGDEKQLIRAISFKGPVSIGIDANFREFMFYHTGIINSTECSSVRLNHGVLAVGYDLTSQSHYYIVKNSWGTDWGEDGYFRILLGKNMCGVATLATYPLI
ncbi:Cathepsin L2 [Thelohanellus kitauei]|uniref:Cathepsin L2 n=1 Tax=Thelohanellus kitauei TaxID=669202 RepID=A0A0C2NBL3_THEKT|nr:Cathepsin L2 [Thelohanellus kitauei]